MSNIKSNNCRKIDCRLIDDVYMDFMLSKEEGNSFVSTNDCLSVSMKFNDANNEVVVSETSWINAIPSDSILENVGYTMVDNGHISYEKDLIGNDEFLELFTDSKFDLSVFGNKFFAKEVSGNTGVLVYPLEKRNDYTAFKGGFYQGFFKIDGNEYQTLPHRISDEWNFNFTLRAQDYETSSNILNKRHPCNKGFFFYIGTRAENKFWELYKRNENVETLKYDDFSDYSSDYNILDSDVIKHQYHEDIPDRNNRDDKYNSTCDCVDYFEDGYDPYGDSLNESDEYLYACDNRNSRSVEMTNLNSYDFSEFNTCHASASCNSNHSHSPCQDNYFDDGYTGEGTTVGCDCPENDLAIEDDYIMQQMSLEGIKLTDNKGYDISERGIYEIETDNKFIIFNNSKNGFNKNTWNPDYKFVITGQTNSPNINYFPYLNHTKSGYTKDTIDRLISEHSYSYDIFKDITNNALGFKVNEDGSISYRYATSDDESEVSYKLEEETSLSGIVPLGEWVNIHIKLKRLSKGNGNECDAFFKPEKMKIYIYVNGLLKFISKELPEINLRSLNDTAEKQEGVPYCISIGGGTQGLSERIMLDYYDISDYLLPLERDFGGTFIGDIKSFSFYDCSLTYETISHLGRSF